ncbi:kinase-like protein [Thelephora ganbajun]|uniref:Kinase-like protein n=1 Tax=Thelephora ganbajun TaxID=370292 RepID=A0ACB6ZE82_THEGA|nr:kinase-like protein [Thelephora ganbajun]
MNVQEMDRIITQATSSLARTDPSESIISLSPLLNTTEGRKFLASQHGEKGLALVELLDWGLQSREVSFDKGRAFSVLRRLCANLETLPKSCILQIKFKPDFPRYAVGEFADVWKGTYDGREVVFKSIRVGVVDEETRKRKRRFAQEVVLWKNVNHPNIHELIGVCCWDSVPDAGLTMVSTWMPNGNIIEYIEHNESHRMELLINCAKGIQYLHRAKLVHGDLKGANILITPDNPVRACLTDFAFTTIAHDESEVGGGTTLFMAPELLCQATFGETRCQVSKEADIYAFGMVILQVLTGPMPFHTIWSAGIANKVIQGDHTAMSSDANDLGISGGLWKLLIRCWDTVYTERPQIKEVLQHLCQDPARGLTLPPSRLPPPSEDPNPAQSYIAETFVNAESRPNQRLVNKLDKGGHSRRPNWNQS